MGSLPPSAKKVRVTKEFWLITKFTRHRRTLKLCKADSMTSPNMCSEFYGISLDRFGQNNPDRISVSFLHKPIGLRVTCGESQSCYNSSVDAAAQEIWDSLTFNDKCDINGQTSAISLAHTVSEAHTNSNQERNTKVPVTHIFKRTPGTNYFMSMFNYIEQCRMDNDDKCLANAEQVANFSA